MKAVRIFLISCFLILVTHVHQAIANDEASLWLSRDKQTINVNINNLEQINQFVDENRTRAITFDGNTLLNYGNGILKAFDLKSNQEIFNKNIPLDDNPTEQLILKSEAKIQDNQIKSNQIKSNQIKDPI